MSAPQDRPSDAQLAEAYRELEDMIGNLRNAGRLMEFARRENDADAMSYASYQLKEVIQKLYDDYYAAFRDPA